MEKASDFEKEQEAPKLDSATQKEMPPTPVPERDTAPTPSVPQAPAPSQQPRPATGALLVEVTTARQSLPIENARVTVKASKAENDLLRTLYTDKSGRTEKIILPAPAAALSESPGNTDVYAAYDVAVEKAGYYSAYAFSVPVFAGITSLQPIALIPLSAYEPENNRPNIGIETTEKEPEL